MVLRKQLTKFPLTGESVQTSHLCSDTQSPEMMFSALSSKAVFTFRLLLLASDKFVTHSSAFRFSPYVCVTNVKHFDIQENTSCGKDRWDEPIGSFRSGNLSSRITVFLILPRLWGGGVTWQTGRWASGPSAEGGHNAVPLAGKHTGANGFGTSWFRTPKVTKKVLFNL